MSATSRIKRRAARFERRVVVEVSKRHAEAVRTAKDELTKYISPGEDDGVVYLQGKLERPFIVVSLWGRYSLRACDPFDERVQPIETVKFRAKQRALLLRNGATAIWYDWEPC